MQDIYKEHLPLTGKNYLTVISLKYTYIYLKTFDQNMSEGPYLHVLNHSLGFTSKSFVYFSLETQLLQFKKKNCFLLIYSKDTYTFDNYQVKLEENFVC